jgi:hypothetical protein
MSSTITLTPRERHLGPKQRRAGPVRSGLAAAEREVVKAGSRAIEVVRIRITGAGRQAIEG